MDDYITPHARSVALLTIDLQRDFSLAGAVAEITGTSAVVPQVRLLVEAFRRSQRPVIHVVRLYCADGSNADACRRQAIERGLHLVVPGSEGAELVDEIKPSSTTRLDSAQLLAAKLQKIGPIEWIVYKPRWGAFYQTALEDHLRHLGVNTVAICGCNFPNCPRATVIEASERDFRIILASDATSGISELGVAEVAKMGIKVMTAVQIVSWLEKAD